ncbi:Na/Pi cotransporter family protein [Sporomusa sphaeroides]|uniref:Na/Pi cotransporter family protein n=1 Tax=Sporomusa sphaeroides TaxID=47679 RepID=UPI002BB8DB4A|nr:Na/Pi symporter [Sporomusa sphaeroides]HML31973.1 Na/Pi symporter [Sporomusa sphaeroides]
MLEIMLGLIMLLGGIFIMRYGLKKALWRRLHMALEKLTQTPWRALTLGTAAAAAFQSSTTVSLVTIGLVSADYMSFRQALGVILGANIGTCSTLQLVNMSVSLDYILPLILLSVLISGLRKKFRYIGLALTGLLSMFAGLEFLMNGISSLSKMDAMTGYLVMAKSQPLYGIWGGLIATVVFQSSSAATALLMLLADMGLVDSTTSAYVIYGNNIGSCISSVVFSAAAPIAARRVALSHILLNVVGVAFFYPLTAVLVSAAGYLTSDFGAQVAAIHTIFNILSSLLVMPQFNQFVNLICLLIPDRRKGAD